MRAHVTNERMPNFALGKGPALCCERERIEVFPNKNCLKRKLWRLLVNRHIAMATGRACRFINIKREIRNDVFCPRGPILIENHVVH